MARESNIPPFLGKEFGSFKNFKFPGGNMDKLLSGYRKNMELMNATQKIVTETMNSLREGQKQYTQKVISEWHKQVENSLSRVPFEEKTAQHTQAVKTTVDETIQHLRSTNSIISQSNKQIIESIQRRFQEVVDESSEILKKSSK